MGLDRYEVTTPAAEYPVTLAEVKAACKITHSAEDDLISQLIIAATNKLEMYTNRVFVERSFTGYFETRECSVWEKGLYFAIRRAPLQSVSQVQVYEDESQNTVSADDYNIKETPGFSRIIFDSDAYYSPNRMPYPWSVDFIAGYGEAADVPDTIKMMIMQYVCFLYTNRGDCVVAKMPEMVKALADEYRILNSFGI